jgi:putative FmdB family regulatory protein
MPKYSFECQQEGCNVRFEKTLKMGEHLSYPCPACKEQAPRLWKDDGFGFQFSEGGKAVANSGVHSHDYPTADMAVGRSADKKWAEYKERQKVKQAARQQGGTNALIRHNGEGFIDYEPMSDGGVVARRNLADAAIKAMRERRDGGK